MINEITFAHEHCTKQDINLFLGPISNDVFEPLINGENWLDILVRSNIFKSKSEARKNINTIKGLGGSIEIAPGFSHIVVGKKKLNIFVLNTF